MAQNVMVCCRFRPPNRNERADGSTNIAEIDSVAMSVKLDTSQISTASSDTTLPPPASTNSSNSSNTPSKENPNQASFNFDAVFDWDTKQVAVYEKTALPLVKDVFQGYNTTIFAYGQTGSGKTHTMMGDPKSPEVKGIIPRIVESIFQGIEESDSNIEFTVKVSYCEIYLEKIRDLLNPNATNLRIRESSSGVWVQDITETYVNSCEQVLDLMQQGSASRAQASTNMNLESSRSHSVFIVTIGQINKSTGEKRGAKLFLVDLAGSEKVAKTGAAGQTLKEAQHINKSLSALGNVINALTSNSAHIPYRDSKLTRLLSDSLGGNCRTCLIITCSPMSSNGDETLSTLRFGTRAKSIKNKPKVNQEKSVGEYKRLLQNALRKIKVQAALILALEGDVTLLRECLSKVSPEHLLTPIPVLSSRELSGDEVLNESDTTVTGEIDDDLIDSAAYSLPHNTTSPLLSSTAFPSSTSELDSISPLASPSSSSSLSSSSTLPSASSSTAATSSSSFGANGSKPTGVHVIPPLPPLHPVDTLSLPPSPVERARTVSATASDVLASLDSRLSALRLRKDELEAKLKESEENKQMLLDQINDLERDKEEAADTWMAEKQRILNDLEEERNRRLSADQRAKSASNSFDQQDLLKKKLEIVTNDHALAMSHLKDENASMAQRMADLMEQLKEAREHIDVLANSMNTEPEPVVMVATPTPTPIDHPQPQPSPNSTSNINNNVDPNINNINVTSIFDPTSPNRLTRAMSTLTALPQTSAHPLSRTSSPAPSIQTMNDTDMFSSPAHPHHKSSSSTPITTPGSAPVSGSKAPYSFNSVNMLTPKTIHTSARRALDLSSYSSSSPSLSDSEHLTIALQKKCDQYIQLQQLYSDSREHVARLEAALDDALTKPKKKIEELEGKLLASQQLNKQLLESSRFWRQDRKGAKPTPKIAMPMHGGGKSNAASPTASAAAAASSSSSSAFGSSNDHPPATPTGKGIELLPRGSSPRGPRQDDMSKFF